MYKIVNNEFQTPIGVSIGNKFIPFELANADYQEYLKWVAEGNTPEPADE